MAQPTDTSWKTMDPCELPTARGPFNIFGLFNRSPQTRPFDLYSESMHLAGIAYRDQKDKGTSDALWHHIHEVEREVETMHGHVVEPGHLVYLKSLAVLHEVFELRDANGKYLYSADELCDMGFPGHFVDDLVALAKFKGEPYLNYAHRVAERPNAMKVKMADIRVNIRDRDHAHDPMSKSLQDKKRFLYPGTLDYFEQIERGNINTSVRPVDHFMRIPDIKNLFREGELGQYWNSAYQFVYSRPQAQVASWMRRKWNGILRGLAV